VSSYIAGLGLGLSLIVAIGAQNLFVLRQGIRREHVFEVALVCALSDAVLITLGVAGLSAVTGAVPWLVAVVRWAGAAFLIGYGVLAARRALVDRGAAANPLEGPVANTRRSVLLACLAFTWLNPHVYLDTVFLLGSVASTHGEARWLFAFGAMTGSFAWFFALAYGARHLSRWLSGPTAARVLDGFVAVVMLVIGASLVVTG
jgi:L-lysine exporter family protein LysE/ArgO